MPLRLSILVAIGCSVSAASAQPPAAPSPPVTYTGYAAPAADTDSDGDGVPDRIERHTGTEPFDADSDDDGVSDGVEDANQDGRVSEGESDPRRAGLFIGSSPHIPEPLNFDLVRGLGARAGELETNVLMTIRPRRGGVGETTWAPEVEWAFADGMALEVEIPMVDREVHALKGALQWTLPARPEGFTHGIQVLGEYLLHGAVAELSVLYLAGGRLGAVSLFTMAGLRATATQGSQQEVLLNQSVFFDANEAVTLGLEGNIALGRNGQHSGLVLAQVHWQVAPRFRVQLGAGAEFEGTNPGAIVVTRLILE